MEYRAQKIVGAIVLNHKKSWIPLYFAILGSLQIRALHFDIRDKDICDLRLPYIWILNIRYTTIKDL